MTGETQDQPLPPAGWYPDPDNPGVARRYWDGTRWTESRAPVEKHDGRDGFEAADGLGYALAVLLPLIGLIVGLVRLNRSPHGIWIVCTSIAMMLLYVILVGSSV